MRSAKKLGGKINRETLNQSVFPNFIGITEKIHTMQNTKHKKEKNLNIFFAPKQIILPYQITYCQYVFPLFSLLFIFKQTLFFIFVFYFFLLILTGKSNDKTVRMVTFKEEKKPAELHPPIGCIILILPRQFQI